MASTPSCCTRASGCRAHMGWMSDALLAMLRFAIEEAARRGMWIMLYDEGMYPSGSASGQVVAENPVYQCRGLERIEIADDAEIALEPGQTLVADVSYKGMRYAIVDRPIDSVIRGLHFLDEDPSVPADTVPAEDEPPAADLLNPDATLAFIRHSYDRYYQAFGDHFGTTIKAIFTDEPNLLGRPRETDIMPGTTDILRHVNAALGYDFTPFLPALWDADAPERVQTRTTCAPSISASKRPTTLSYTAGASSITSP